MTKAWESFCEGHERGKQRRGRPGLPVLRTQWTCAYMYSYLPIRKTTRTQKGFARIVHVLKYILYKYGINNDRSFYQVLTVDG